MDKPNARNFDDFTKFLNAIITYVEHNEEKGSDLSKTATDAADMIEDWAVTSEQANFFQADVNTIRGEATYGMLIFKLNWLRDNRKEDKRADDLPRDWLRGYGGVEKRRMLNDVDHFPLRYMQLWCYALRNFPYIDDRKFNALRADMDSTSTSLRLKYNSDFGRLARHALSLGFSLKKGVIHDASNTNAHNFDVVSLEKPELSTNNEGLPEKERSNRPYERSFHRNRSFITLEKVVAIHLQTCGAYPTPFAVTRDMIFRFWGDILPPSESTTGQRNVQHESDAQDVPAPDGDTTANEVAGPEFKKEHFDAHTGLDQHDHSSTNLVVSSKRKTGFPGPDFQTLLDDKSTALTPRRREQKASHTGGRKRDSQDNEMTIPITESATNGQAQIPG
ncbi:hypothetical protein M409DRAFT_61221 [Zasmidium cellare ATCC 36951]|uniref:Uncharacterized protein n=1 Tax=Zasmidium cellare ATCC 36951 TaxID=1080233 RepID=A0A6A6BVY6_ZASCE|nr:uncharacterized protein M409DRAFT_61221 [Zasmidium cellare ATCC 36951]KAF2158951.1 hypothetical protein M409DRAFT_61221 [Zasmidium cellare ATCC 36951]